MADRPALSLHLFTEEHLPAFAETVNEPEVARFTRFPVPAPADFAEQWYARYQAGRQAGTHEAFAALDPEGRFVGLALAPELNAETGEAELGYLVPAAARGHGYASELLRQLTDWAFTERAILRAGLMISVDNVASQRVAVRAGYQLDGTLRSTYFKQGIRVDTQIWSRLPSDPPPDS